MILTNANIFTSDAIFEVGSVFVNDGKIEKVQFGDNTAEENEEIIDCNGNYLIPGLIDIHFHGCDGHDFCDADIDGFKAIADYELKNGITAICPATLTNSKEKLTEIMKFASDISYDGGADFVGINMEGPFISKDKVGAQNPDFVQEPDYEMLIQLQKASNNLIKIVDIAPEVNGAMDLIKKASNDFCISIAHTCSDYETAKEAYYYGARHLTHTFNAMPSIHHRNPGPIVAASESNAFAELICDGQHVDYAAVRLAFKMFEDRVCLISDSCEATGLEDGQYDLGGLAINKIGDKVVLADKPDTIAASATNLYNCFKHAVVDAEINLEDAILAASTNPAIAIGIDSLYGSIEPGKFADLLLIDEDINLIDVYKKGIRISDL